MARKSKHPTKTRSGARRESPPTQSGAKSLIAGRHASTAKNPHKASSASPTQNQSVNTGGSSAASATLPNNDADESDVGGAEADRDKDDEGDGDAMASSDTAIASNGDQTGHKMGTKQRSATGEKRKYSSDKFGGGKQRVRGRKALKSTTQFATGNVESDDDDDYNGVDLISDSEEEEPTVEQLEEKVIIESEEEYDSNCRAPPVLPSISSDEGWNGFDLEGDLFLSDVPYFDEQIGRTDSSILAEEIEIYNSTSFSQSFFDINVELPPRIAPIRRVRFAEDVLDSENISAIAMASEMEHNALAGSSPAGVANGDEGAASENHDSEDEDGNSSSGRSSGYETDLGETTEEEDVPASATTRPQSLLRRTSMSSLQESGSITPTPKRRLPPTPPGYRWGPTMGSWIADPTKPIVMVDSSGTKLVIFPPQRPKRPSQAIASLGSSASSANSSPRPSVPRLANTAYDSEIGLSACSSQEPVSPMVGSSPNLMMSGLLNVSCGTEHLTGGQVLGPPEAFFPFTNFDAGGNVIMDDDDDEDEDDLLNLEDFIDFGEDTDDSDIEGVIKAHHSPSASSVTSAVSPVDKSSASNLMDHLDKGVVTAFRRNQYNHETAQRRPSVGSAQRTNPAFKGARHATADVSLSPLKKRRLSDAFDVEEHLPHDVDVKGRSIIDTY